METARAKNGMELNSAPKQYNNNHIPFVVHHAACQSCFLGNEKRGSDLNARLISLGDRFFQLGGWLLSSLRTRAMDRRIAVFFTTTFPNPNKLESSTMKSIRS
mmetsp:Transcript_14194/g.33025  ORF Transcript_14194/g.33025 Transcript_14194/m.33025 type:complete len:103 (+) Transcript_14194:303-611(+)